MFRLAIVLAACLLAAGFSSWPGMSAGLAAHLVAPDGTSPLLPPAPINAALARLHDRSGHVTTDSGLEVFWRAITRATTTSACPGRKLKPLPTRSRSWTSASRPRPPPRRAAQWYCCTAG